MDKIMQNVAGNILLRIFEPSIDFIMTWLTVNVALIAQLGFAEDDEGNLRRVKGSGAILVVNRSREPIKIIDMGLILKNKQRISVSSQIVGDDQLPITISPKDNKAFPLKRQLFLNLSPIGIQSIKKVYVEDSVLNTITSGVPKWQKQTIAYSIYGPKEEVGD